MSKSTHFPPPGASWGRNSPLAKSPGSLCPLSITDDIYILPVTNIHPTEAHPQGREVAGTTALGTGGEDKNLDMARTVAWICPVSPRSPKLWLTLTTASRHSPSASPLPLASSHPHKKSARKAVPRSWGGTGAGTALGEGRKRSEWRGLEKPKWQHPHLPWVPSTLSQLLGRAVTSVGHSCLPLSHSPSLSSFHLWQN